MQSGHSTLVLCISAFATAASGSLSSAGPTAYNGVNKIIAATLLFRASSSFDNILISEGRDVSNLLRGLGMNGLSKLFHNLNSLAWGVVASQVCTPARVGPASAPSFGPTTIISKGLKRCYNLTYLGQKGYSGVAYAYYMCGTSLQNSRNMRIHASIDAGRPLLAPCK